MPDSLPYGEFLPGVYRFAFLMTGVPEVAADVLRLVVEQAEGGKLGDVRDARRVRRWLFSRARALCARPVPTILIPVPAAVGGEPSAFPSLDTEVPVAGAPDEPTAALAQCFAVLPEAERSALVLFYLYVFDSEELAEVLDIKTEELGPRLLRGRAILKKRMKVEG